MRDHVNPADRRRYIRLDHIYPVEFCFTDKAGTVLSTWYQAYTQDISSAGLCLTANCIDFADAKFLIDKEAALFMRINIPLGTKPVEARGHVAWHKTTRDEPTLQYALGVYYISIDESGNKRIINYAKTKKLFKAIAITFVIFLSLGLSFAGFYNARLKMENEKLLNSLAVNLSHQKALKSGSDNLKSQIDETKFLLSQSERKMEMLQRRLDLVYKNDQKMSDSITGSINFLKRYHEKIKTDIADLVARKTKVDDDVSVKLKEASLLEAKIRAKLYRWLGVHQNSNTGLVASFEGDKEVSDWGFTYDQALAVIVFTKAGEPERAKKIFNFYLKAQRDDAGGFYNAYYTNGGETAEFTVHAGPNIWLGLAALQYCYITGDLSYLKIAGDVACWLESVRDQDGGLRGARHVTWYSTEHNLDAYAFYSMFAKLTNDESYARKAAETLNWLNKNAYSKISEPIVKRGKGDSTIATDTYAWSITAVTPEVLKNSGMNPDEIMDFALANCSVEADYRRPDGVVCKVKGFDFAKHQNLARGGVVSCEWSAQMILALKIMGDYSRSIGDEEKAGNYDELAREYTSELSKMIITSPSPVGQGDFCLPYASHEFADTGHGWRTPKGNRTGSVAATAYAILALDGFNPLGFNKQKV